VLRGTAARRYAEAVFSLALEAEATGGPDGAGLERWQQDLSVIAGVLGNEDVQSFMESPNITEAQKRDILKRALAALVSVQALHMTYLLAERGRTALISHIVRRFKELVDIHRGVQEAEVTTAVALEEAQRVAVIARLEAMTGRTIVLSERVDLEILGGVVLRIGDTLVDDSLAHRLAELRGALASARRGT